MKQIHLAELTKQDVDDMQRLFDLAYTKDDITEVLAEVAKGYRQLWRDTDLLFITQINTHPSGRELYMWGLVGKGLVNRGTEIRDKIIKIAKDKNCRWICGLNRVPKLKDFYKELGFKLSATEHLMEV